MTSEWEPIFVLPNIPLKESIGCNVAALAPASDSRVETLCDTYPTFQQFLNRFSDNFGKTFEPTVFIVHAEAPAGVRDISALASFRDLIAISTIGYNRARELRHPRGPSVLFGEAFTIYPWMLDRDYEYVVGRTPAISGLHEVQKFRGQSSPALFRTTLGQRDIDEPLLDALLLRWHRRYGGSEPDWADTALFRSLNMAYNASLLPAGIDATFYDVGRVISLWISAFEILIHPGGSGQANCDKVFDLIEKTPWVLRRSGVLDYETGGKSKVKRTLASWLYQKLYECRNNFLHGNPVERQNLILSGSGRRMFDYAAPLYRIALTSFLSLAPKIPMPETSDGDAMDAFIERSTTLKHAQKTFEEAIHTAVEQQSRR